MTLMLDLCCGLGGASAAMRDRGWDVVRVDIRPDVGADIIADIRQWAWDGPSPRLIWVFPPCDEFSREDKPWTRKGITPDLSILQAAVRIIAAADPDYWAIENVRGAQPWFRPVLGGPSYVANPYYLWGNLPPLPRRLKFRPKGSVSPGPYRALQRAVIPYGLSAAIADVCDQMQLTELVKCPRTVLTA